MADFLASLLTALTDIFFIGLLGYFLGSFIDDAIRATVRSELREHDEQRARIARLESSSEKPSA